MLLFVLRHGQAEPGRPGSDADRRLTAEGRLALRRTLQRAAASGLKPNLLLSSPYVRARETSEIVREELGFSGEVLLSNALVPDSASEAVWDEVRVHSQPPRDDPAAEPPEQQLLLVGHNPLLSDFLMQILETGEQGIDLRPGSLACVDVGSVQARPHGRLLWLLTPETGS